MELLLATHNPHKAEEYRRMVSKMGYCIRTLDDLNIQETPEETGATFRENALIKARALYKKTGLPVLADDSGLEIKALDGRPGVYSARYAGEGASSLLRNQTILQELEGVCDRTARFVCVICYIDPKGQPSFVEGICEGKIGLEGKGENGFGYDPIFYVGDRSFAQLTSEEKDRISHRGRALHKLAELLQSLKEVK